MGVVGMKYEAIIKFCPISPHQKKWSAVLGEFDTPEEAKKWIDENVSELLPPLAHQFGVAQRMLFFIKGKEGSSENT